RQAPRVVPAQLRLVEQQPHQLWHCHGGMRVVQLDSDLIRQRLPLVPRRPKTPYEISQRTSDEEVLLHETQPLALRRRVVRVEHARGGLSGKRFRQGTNEISTAELSKVEEVGSAGRPKAEGVDGAAAVANHWPVVRNAD